VSRRIAIWNPASGSAPDEQKLKDALGNDVELIATTEEDPGPGQAAHAVEVQAEALIACGGDGTVRACLDPIAGTDTALGIVPLGTGNLLASNLNISSGLDEAHGAGRGSRRTIDMGRINGEAFAVMAGSGFDARMIADANSALKSRLGTVAYVISGAKNLRNGLVTTTVDVDGARWFQGRTSMVLVGNFGTISGGIDVFPDAQPDDGVLDVTVMSASTVREWGAIAWRLLRRKPMDLRLAHRTQGTRIQITHAEPRIYELDGEAREPATELLVEIEPNAITIQQESMDIPQKDDANA